MNIHYEKEQESFKKYLQCNGEKTLSGLSIDADTKCKFFSEPFLRAGSAGKRICSKLRENSVVQLNSIIGKKMLPFSSSCFQICIGSSFSGVVFALLFASVEKGWVVERADVKAQRLLLTASSSGAAIRKLSKGRKSIPSQQRVHYLAVI